MSADSWSLLAGAIVALVAAAIVFKRRPAPTTAIRTMRNGDPVILRRMDGCMAHYIGQEDAGYVLGVHDQLVIGAGPEPIPVVTYMIPGERPQSMPLLCFNWVEKDGAWVREY